MRGSWAGRRLDESWPPSTLTDERQRGRKREGGLSPKPGAPQRRSGTNGLPEFPTAAAFASPPTGSALLCPGLAFPRGFPRGSPRG
jgi:hypothetical protein